MTENLKPKVAVLMAVYNGHPWIVEQIETILNQADLNVFLYISDDASTDGAASWLEVLSSQNKNVILLPSTKRSRGAARNFFRLVAEVDLSAYDFVAFSDQDDAWLPGKLKHQVDQIKKLGVDGVSSNVMAFWPDGKEKLLDKAQPQREFDYLFESAGPGCTFLMTPWLVNKVREQLLDDASSAKDVALHDWLTYAICRVHGRKWAIDSKPSVRYRQHGNNVVGANVGFKAKWARLKKLKQGWYRKEVIKIAQVCNSIAPDNETNRLLVLLQTKNLISQLKLLAYVSKARRSLVDRFLLATSIVVGLF
jgi:rhamnosyltransferase